MKDPDALRGISQTAGEQVKGDFADTATLFEAIGQHLEQTGSLPRDSVVSGLGRREQLASTGLGQGIAIPHCRVRDLERIRVAYLRLKTPIPFNAPDGQPVSEFLVLLVPKQATDEHLAILADAARLFDDAGFRTCLRQCGEATAVKRLFDSHA